MGKKCHNQRFCTGKTVKVKKAKRVPSQGLASSSSASSPSTVSHSKEKVITYELRYVFTVCDIIIMHYSL